MPRIKEFRERAKITQLELAKSLKTTRPIVSYFEHYECLPTPEQLHNLLNILNCNINDLYQKNEITYKDNRNIQCIHAKTECIQTVGVNSRVNTYNFCVRVHRDDFPLLTKNTLAECGYNSLREFLFQAYKVLQKRYNKIKKEASSLNDEKPQSA